MPQISSYFLYIYIYAWQIKIFPQQNFSNQWQPSPQQIICGSKTYQMQAHQESSGQPGDFGPIHWQRVTVIRTWKSNYIHTFLWDIITDPCLLASCASAKLFLKLGHWWAIIMMTSSNENIFRVTGHLCREFIGPRWIPHTKVSDEELWCFLWSASE